MSAQSNEQRQLNALLYNNLGILIGPEVRASGIAMLRRAAALDPANPDFRLNLAAHLVSAGQNDEPFELLERVLAERPNDAIAWDIMGCLATRRGGLEVAIHCYERALALDPSSAQRAFNLAAAYLRNGEFEPGLRHYEGRRKLNGTLVITPPDVPEWDGRSPGHVVVYAEQGTGDKIMFARFLPWVKEVAGRVTFMVDPLTMTLFAGYERCASLVLPGAPIADADWQIPLGSLPRVYGLTPDTIPPDPGWISVADSSDSLQCAGLKIGICWAGNDKHPNDDIRSLKFTDLLPLAADPRNALFSLQGGPRSADIAAARAQRLVTDLSGLFEGEWTHTAAVIGQMDLVVSADTGVAHLAAALGKPVFMMIARFSDWRWLWGRTTSPWYPTLRLFRQAKVHDWKPVVAEVEAAIAQLHVARMLRDQVRAATRPAIEPQIAAAGAVTAEGIYEPEIAGLMRRVLRPGDCFVDVGANVGRHTVAGADLVGAAGRVIAFEPGANNLARLREAIGARGNVEVIAAPAWHTAAPVRFHLCADAGDGHALWDPGLHPHNPKSRAEPLSVTMQASTLDIELGKRDLKPRLIKIDVEGAEQFVLEGAGALLASWARPSYVVAELHEFGLGQLGCTQESFRALMAGHGYEAFLMPADGSRPIAVGAQVLSSRWIVNLLFSTAAAVDAAWPAACSLAAPLPPEEAAA
jgi:FkbM family methyltransferase